ncbi:unnamed protein product, partial [Oppiella nova]
MYLLHRYLHLKYGSESDAKSKFAQLMDAHQINLEIYVVFVVLKLRTLKCNYDNNCPTDMDMRTEFILNDEEKEIRKRKIRDNKQKQMICQTIAKTDVSTDTSKHIPNDTFNETEGMKFRELMSATEKGRFSLTFDVLKWPQVLDPMEAIKVLTIHCERVHHYYNECEHWKFPQENNCATLLKLQVFKNYQLDSLLLEHGKDFESDKIILDLVYMYLLQRYLQMKYQSKCEADSKFTKLMNLITSTKGTQQELILKFLSALPSDVCPLLNEIYDRTPVQTLLFSNLD